MDPSTPSEEPSRRGGAESLPLLADGTEPGPPLVVPPAAHGRAGRALGPAAGVGFGLGILVFGSLFFYRPAFAIFVTVAIVVGVWELSKAFTVAGIRASREVLAVGSVAIILGAYVWGPPVLLAAFGLTVIAGLADRMRLGSSGFVRDVTASVFIAAYAPVLAAFAAMLASADDGLMRTMTFIATVVASDIGGYAAGVAFGRHPMAPKISPKKSWEGFAGSVVACILTASLMVGLGTSFPWWAGLIIGVLVVITATGGDLVESMIKRDLGVKDMGNLLPGHGGIMDRLDSMLPSAMVCWLVFALLT
jgi:phosphatidate cytidylyltransferase